MSRVRSRGWGTGLASSKRSVLHAVLLVFAALPFEAFALAGLAEHDYIYHFNRHAQLVWRNPGDSCEGVDKYCLELRREDRRELEGIGGSLEVVNLPTDPESPYVLAQRSVDGAWFVYDLGEQRFVVETVTLDEALSAWAALGLARPTLIDSRNPDRHLEETSDSRAARWGFRILLMAMGAVVPSLVLALLFGGIARLFANRHRRTGSPYQRMAARIFMVPAATAGAVLVLSVGILIGVRILGF